MGRKVMKIKMLSDVFLEYLIKREKDKKDHLTVAGIILGALIV